MKEKLLTGLMILGFLVASLATEVFIHPVPVPPGTPTPTPMHPYIFPYIPPER